MEMFHRVDHCNHFRGTLEAEKKSLTQKNNNLVLIVGKFEPIYDMNRL